jgi:acyl carrier protein phosphodiesterase
LNICLILSYFIVCCFDKYNQTMEEKLTSYLSKKLINIDNILTNNNWNIKKQEMDNIFFILISRDFF